MDKVMPTCPQVKHPLAVLYSTSIIDLTCWTGIGLDAQLL